MEKEIFEKLKRVYSQADSVGREIMEREFPELAESEDERIRKWLIKSIHLIGVDRDICADQETMDKAIAWLERQKEQKPVETSDFKTKLAEYLQNNTPKDGQYVISSESILQMAKEELIKRGVVQKPVEWSKEDEMYLSQAIETLEHENYSILADKLKSLRPSRKPSEVCYGAKGDPDPAGVWKPSEEDERKRKMLIETIDSIENFPNKGVAIAYLEKQKPQDTVGSVSVEIRSNLQKDEVVRKTLIMLVDAGRISVTGAITNSDILDWLEKQKGEDGSEG